MFKSKKWSDPDTPIMREALSGLYWEQFLDAMETEITELEDHDTWDVMKRNDIQPTELTDGTIEIPQVIPSTWVYRIKRIPNGEFKKAKACFIVRGDLQEQQNLKSARPINGEPIQTKVFDREGNPFDTYAAVAFWTSIRMLTTMALEQGWVTK